MMKSEFIERTGYEPGDLEYHYIEESYYEFPGDKNEFCKQWKKDYKDGHWQREMNLMCQIDQQKADYEKQLEEKEDSLKFYRKQFDAMMAAQKELKAAQEKLTRLERVFRRTFIEE